MRCATLARVCRANPLGPNTPSRSAKRRAFNRLRGFDSLERIDSERIQTQKVELITSTRLTSFHLGKFPS
jgi:hypothetical protein